MTQPRGRSSGGRSPSSEARAFVAQWHHNLQTRCSHRASPYAQSRASPGPSFYAHGAASAFCSSQARSHNRDRDRQDGTLLILDCRLLPPNNRLPFTPVPQPICLACPTASFICGRWGPRHGRLKKRERKRESLWSTFKGASVAQPVRSMYTCTLYNGHTRIGARR